MNIRRITRLLKVLQHLQSRSGLNIDGLANACAVSRRTTFRDIEALRGAGVPIAYDSDYDRYTIPGTHFLPPINLTETEALSLVTLAVELGRGDRLPFYESARSAALKLESSLPPALRERLGAITRAIHIRPGPVSRHFHGAGIYQQLLDARAARRVVRISYEGTITERPVATDLRPYHLLFCNHCWYVVGRSSFHGQVLAFNLNRIQSFRELHRSYSIPDGFSLERFLGNAWLMSTESDDDHQVVIHFMEPVARNVAEVEWHKTQCIEFQENGSLIFCAQVSGLNEIAAWILGFGDQAEVIEPKQLRELVAQQARNMIALYSGACQPRARLASREALA